MGPLSTLLLINLSAISCYVNLTDIFIAICDLFCIPTLFLHARSYITMDNI